VQTEEKNKWLLSLQADTSDCAQPKHCTQSIMDCS